MIHKINLQSICKSRKILIHEENFAYFLPCEQLSSLISNFTISFPNDSIISEEYTIMPHGSVTLVFFYYKSKLHSFLFGPTSKPIKVGNLANKCDSIFIIEFQPAGFYPFSKINQKELTDKIVPYSFINHLLDKCIRDIYHTSFSIDALLDNIEKKLITCIDFPYPQELTLCIEAIIQNKGVLTTIEIAKNGSYSPRHLNRLFNLHLGMSMKSFSRLVRINNSIHFLNEKANSLAFICEKLGYYDVAHFVKDFKIICKITPQEYRMNMSNFYNEIAKF